VRTSSTNSVQCTLVVSHSGGWIGFSPFSSRVAYAKSEDALVSFVEDENKKYAHEVVCSRLDFSASVRRVALILTKDCPMRCI